MGSEPVCPSYSNFRKAWPNFSTSSRIWSFCSFSFLYFSICFCHRWLQSLGEKIFIWVKLNTASI